MEKDFSVSKPKTADDNCQESKPLEIYMFIDPLCPECWALEPIMKKLQIEYGRYFSLKHVLSGRLSALNCSKKSKYANIAEFWEKTASRSGMSCDGSLWFDNPIISPHLPSIALKAAELQGRKSGMKFLRKLQELLFLEKKILLHLKFLNRVLKVWELM